MITANESEPRGLNIETGEIDPISKLQIHDHRKTKEWAIRLASEAAITILRIDQIIIAKPAGGPKMQQNKNWDEDNWYKNIWFVVSNRFYIFIVELTYILSEVILVKLCTRYTSLMK